MDAGRHPRIEILINTELVALTGQEGDFNATVRHNSTAVDLDECTACGDCAEVCPIIAPNNFDVGLGARRAIFRAFPQAVPAVYTIDPSLCLNDGALISCENCSQACPKDAIDLERKPFESTLSVGSVIVATGFEEFDPGSLRRYGYKTYPNVVTSLELERLLNASGPTLGHVIRPSDRRTPHNLVYVQCVGSRGESDRPNCSRFCCMNAVKDAILLKQHDPDLESVTILYMDIRAFGKGFDELYERARSNEWINFTRGRPAKITENPETNDLIIHVENTESSEQLKLSADMVVLSCAGLPTKGADLLAKTLGIDTNPTGFVATDATPGSIGTSRNGIYVCGGASGPQVIPDCVAQGSAAATEAAISLVNTGNAPEKMIAKSSETGQPPPDTNHDDAQDTPSGNNGDSLVSVPDPVDRSDSMKPQTAAEDGCQEWASEMTEVAEAWAAGDWSDLLGDKESRVSGSDPSVGQEGRTLEEVSCCGTEHPESTSGGNGGGETNTLTTGSTAGLDTATPPRDASSFAGDLQPGPSDPAGTPRVGIFLCHCGINIAGVLDMKQLLDYANRLPGVVIATDEIFACSSSSQLVIQDAIKEHHLNRVIIAACTPRTHEPIFRENCLEAGLNPYLLEMVNIRDQCSWVHAGDPDAATDKACDLMRMAVARSRDLQPLEPTEVGVTQKALVVGGGMPGMKAAGDLACLGFDVTLIERTGNTGGLLNKLHSLYPAGKEAAEMVGEMTRRLKKKGVTLKLNTELREVTGFVGNFTATLGPASSKPGVGFAKSGKTENIDIGAIILAIGADEYQPAQGEFAFGKIPQVITASELEKRLAAPGKNLAGVKTVAFIQCVGSRRPGSINGKEPGYPGCSRTCCATTIKQSIELNQNSIDSVVCYRDMRLVGCSAEEMYAQARTSGTVFLRFDAEAPPKIRQSNNQTFVDTDETLIHRTISAPVDLVVLATGMVPRIDSAQHIQEILKTPKGADGFFLERHPELAPVETCVDGVIVCGAAQGPKDLADSLAQASAAAAKAANLIGNKKLYLDPAVSTITADLCRGCGLCVSMCEFHAPEIEITAGQTPRASINAALCKGCGTCAVWCPTGAIRALHYTDQQITSMIDSLFLSET